MQYGVAQAGAVCCVLLFNALINLLARLLCQRKIASSAIDDRRLTIDVWHKFALLEDLVTALAE
jgi:hypothetical protein